MSNAARTATQPTAAPACTLPAAENDARQPRPVCFTNRASAVAHAKRLARLASPSGSYHATQYLTDTFRPVEGGNAYAVRLGALDWEVVTVSEAEVTRCQQAWSRRSIESHLEVARAHDLAAGLAKPGSSWERQHLVNAKRERDAARTLELRLTVSVVVAQPDAPLSTLADDGGFALAGRNSGPCKCARGKRIYRDNMCVLCAEDEFEASNRARPAHEQRD